MIPTALASRLVLNAKLIGLRPFDPADRGRTAGYGSHEATSVHKIVESDARQPDDEDDGGQRLSLLACPVPQRLIKLRRPQQDVHDATAHFLGANRLLVRGGVYRPSIHHRIYDLLGQAQW